MAEVLMNRFSRVVAITLSFLLPACVIVYWTIIAQGQTVEMQPFYNMTLNPVWATIAGVACYLGNIYSRKDVDHRKKRAISLVVIGLLCVLPSGYLSGGLLAENQSLMIGLVILGQVLFLVFCVVLLDDVLSNQRMGEVMIIVGTLVVLVVISSIMTAVTLGLPVWSFLALLVAVVYVVVHTVQFGDRTSVL